VLDHFEAAEHVAFGVRQVLPCSAVRIAASSFMFSRISCWYFRKMRARAPIGVLRQVLNASFGRATAAFDFVGGGDRHAREQLLRRRVDDVAPLARYAGIRWKVSDALSLACSHVSR
jgi:hypothetical protein